MRARSALALLSLAAGCRNEPDPGAARSPEPAKSIATTAREPATAPSPDPSTASIAPADSTLPIPPAEKSPAQSRAQGEPPKAPPRLPTAERDLAPPSPAATASSAPSTEKSPSIPARRGPAATGPSYETWLETTGGYRAGAPSSLVVVLNAKEPFKCNAQYPYKLVLDPPPGGVTFPNSTVRGMQVNGKHATMPVAFTAESAGSHTVSGTLSFSTCTADKCLVDKAHLSVAVEVL